MLKLPQVARKLYARRTMKFTSRILVGLVARWGFVEPREGIGLRMLDAEKN